MSRTLLLCWVVVFWPPVVASAHELPAGEIERRVQVVVKPDCVLVEYSLGMSEATLDNELRKNGIQPADSLFEKWKQFQEMILPSLPQGMVVTLDGDPVILKPIRADYSGWSHRHLTCLLKAEVKPSEKLLTIVVTDGNYLDAPGEYRIAMKGRSGTKMKKSKLVPTVSRAKPVELANLTKKKKQAATRVEGEFVISDRKNRNTEGCAPVCVN
ncbi:MAG: hypothetical protein GY768_11075 [Planctomycetaceae bacterium]|nr:hypothetical protein [Planctomycetaceae bacterium]